MTKIAIAVEMDTIRVIELQITQLSFVVWNASDAQETQTGAKRLKRLSKNAA
ncbi:MAG: hypothetical protein ABSE82_13580 [Nitrososphaerales archaeon]